MFNINQGNAAIGHFTSLWEQFNANKCIFMAQSLELFYDHMSALSMIHYPIQMEAILISAFRGNIVAIQTS